MHRLTILEKIGLQGKPGRGLRSPAADSRKIAKVRGRLSRAARPQFSAGLQTGLHTTGLDIMSYDIQIFHVLVTPGTSSTTPDTPSKRRVPGSRRGMRRARQSWRNGGEDPGRGLRSPAADSRKIAKVRGRLSRQIAKVRGRLSRKIAKVRGPLSRAARRRFSAGLQSPITGSHLC
ncbi:unnamed protein product [Boreogadus saida]